MRAEYEYSGHAIIDAVQTSFCLPIQEIGFTVMQLYMVLAVYMVVCALLCVQIFKQYSLF